MILKKILLNNIRSYENQEIIFKEGSTLLSGDIGTGKTSVLLAIEFALFGLQPGQRGSALLRNGKNEGSISIELEIEGKNIFIERTLKKSKTISQDYAAITIDGVKEEIAVTELKSRVLELLNYPKEFSKKQNLLYKFTVYTPQEEMKQIILHDSKTRVNILRHIFGIDKYKRIIENASIVTSKIKEEIKIKQAMISTLEQDKENFSTKEDELKSKNQNISVLEWELSVKSDKKNKTKNELNEILNKKEEKIKLQQEIEKTNLVISTKKNSNLDNKRILEQLTLQIQELQSLSFNSLKLDLLQQDINLNKKMKIDLNEKILEVKSKINSLTSNNQENELIKEKLKHIEVCPTCLQDVNTTYKNNVLKKVDLSISDNIKRINELSSMKMNISDQTKEIENKISSNEQQIQELNILKIKMQGIREKQERINEIKKTNSMINADINILDKQLITLKSSILELNKFDILFEEKQKQLDEAMKQEKMAEIKLAELKREIQVFSNQIYELKERIERAEKIKDESNYLIDLEAWISKQFMLMINSVEKNVMNKLKTEFSKLFSDWFSKLVSDSFNITLDDEFTPVVEHQDYVIDYDYLSGGERTAIALAYRLALNQVINSLLSEIKTKGFIILDEPTDGFSGQQLDKMREVLEELNVNQLIIVSHEQRMEDFVDDVIKFKKLNGKSVVEF